MICMLIRGSRAKRTHEVTGSGHHPGDSCIIVQVLWSRYLLVKSTWTGRREKTNLHTWIQKSESNWTKERLDQSLDRVSLAVFYFIWLHFAIDSTVSIGLSHLACASSSSNNIHIQTHTYIAKLLQNLSHYGINSIASTLPWFLPNSLSHSISPPLCTPLIALSSRDQRFIWNIYSLRRTERESQMQCGFVVCHIILCRCLMHLLLSHPFPLPNLPAY